MVEAERELEAQLCLRHRDEQLELFCQRRLATIAADEERGGVVAEGERVPLEGVLQRRAGAADLACPAPVERMALRLQQHLEAHHALGERRVGNGDVLLGRRWQTEVDHDRFVLRLIGS